MTGAAQGKARLSCHFAFLLSSRARSCSPTLLRAHFPLAFAHLKEFDEERLMPHSAFYNRIPCSGASVSHSGPLYPIPLSLSAVDPLVTWPPLLLQCSRASLPPQQATGPPSSAAAVGSWPLFLPLPDFAAGDGRELGAAASPFCPLLSFSFFYPLIARSCTAALPLRRTVPSVQSQFRNEPAFCQSRSLSFP